MDSSSTNLIEGRQLPYLTLVPNDGRCIVVMTYYDHLKDRFHCYTAQPDGRLFQLCPVSMVSGMYVAKSPADADHDIHLPFSETVFQHFSLSGIWSLLNQLEHDMLNGLASLHKYFVILLHSKTHDDGTAGPLISTEVEYAIGNHRSFYDLINRVVMEINASYHPHPQKLADSFERLVQKDHSYLSDRLKLPLPVVDFYKSRANLFLVLCDIRDNIFHHGHSPGTIFIGDDGFAIAVDDRFSGRLQPLNLWPDHLLKPNRLGSILAVLEAVVRDMFDAVKNLGKALTDSFAPLPPAVADSYRVYLRSPLSKHFHMLTMYREKHWFDPGEILDDFLSVERKR